jgi:hypothetical protein
MDREEFGTPNSGEGNSEGRDGEREGGDGLALLDSEDGQQEDAGGDQRLDPLSPARWRGRSRDSAVRSYRRLTR